MKKILALGSGVFTLAAAGLVLVPGFAGAQSENGNANGNGERYGYQQTIETKAELFGMTADELKTQLQEKTMLQVAEENGVSMEKLRETVRANAQKRWEEKGLSDEEIKARQQSMEERQANCDGDGEPMQQHRGGKF
jgi:hypothetical protein